MWCIHRPSPTDVAPPSEDPVPDSPAGETPPSTEVEGLTFPAKGKISRRKKRILRIVRDDLSPDSARENVPAPLPEIVGAVQSRGGFRPILRRRRADPGPTAEDLRLTGSTTRVRRFPCGDPLRRRLYRPHRHRYRRLQNSRLLRRTSRRHRTHGGRVDHTEVKPRSFVAENAGSNASRTLGRNSQPHHLHY